MGLQGLCFQLVINMCFDISAIEVTEGQTCVTVRVGSSYFYWACYGDISCVIDIYWN